MEVAVGVTKWYLNRTPRLSSTLMETPVSVEIVHLLVRGLGVWDTHGVGVRGTSVRETTLPSIPQRRRENIWHGVGREHCFNRFVTRNKGKDDTRHRHRPRWRDLETIKWTFCPPSPLFSQWNSERSIFLLLGSVRQVRELLSITATIFLSIPRLTPIPTSPKTIFNVSQ